MSKKLYYKYCIVPCCRSTTVKTPEKIFFNVPQDPKKRKAWTKAMKRDDKLNKLSLKSARSCCQDHFLLPQDMENYWQWKITNDVKRVQLKPNVVPHIFDCQRKTPILVERSAVKKRKNMHLVQEAMSYYSAEIPSTSSATSKFSSTSSEVSATSQKHGDLQIHNGIQVKREFVKYFQMGLSVSEAKKLFIMYYKRKKPGKKYLTLIPTLRQAEILYKEWQDMKCSLNNTLKEGIWRKSKQGTRTIKKFLHAVPKREAMYAVKRLESETNILVKSEKGAQNQDIKFPLVFVTIDSVAGMPDSTAPLLYKLKDGICDEHVSDLVRPWIYSLYIESENSSEPVSNEILEITTSVDGSKGSVEATPKYTLDIPLKLESLNDGYEDITIQGSTETMEDTSLLPTLIDAFSCGDATTEKTDIKPNIYSGDVTTTGEIGIKPNICKAGNSFFPLMFTLRCLDYETSNNRSLIYDLKQSSTAVQATEAVVSQICFVQINSLTEARFQLKDASILTVEGPLNITIQTDPLKVNSNTVSSNDGMNERVDGENLPVIIDVSSCSDHLPVITDYQSLSQKDQGETSDPGNVNEQVENKRLETEIKQEGQF